MIASRIPDDVKMILHGSKIADDKTDLIAMSRMPVERQRVLASFVDSGKAETLREARYHEWQGIIRKQQRDIDRGRVVLPSGVFEVIAIDPPWPYHKGEDVTNWPWRPGWTPAYAPMALDEIAKMKIPANPEGCVLFLWTTHKFMRHAFKILDAWGFEERSIITWVKKRRTGEHLGGGRWLRNTTDFAIMAVTGSPQVLLTTQTTVIHGAFDRHSEKPVEFYELVESLCVGRRLEMFARSRRSGWEAHGLEIDAHRPCPQRSSAGNGLVTVRAT
ncbi:MAG: MT-A70 family methyltransferase [Proteobacteria bacterium]|nr:MT-A70 family methyltransferase [Pseudomonadota bacterium]